MTINGGRLLFLLRGVGSLLMILLLSPLTLIRAISGLNLLILLRTVLLILSGSLYLSTVGLIYWGAMEIMEINTALGLSVGVFIFSSLTIGAISLILAIASRVNNAN